MLFIYDKDILSYLGRFSNQRFLLLDAENAIIPDEPEVESAASGGGIRWTTGRVLV